MELSSNTINLSSLISMELNNTRIDIMKKGIKGIDLLASVTPFKENDHDFVRTYLSNNANKSPPQLQTPNNAGKQSRIRGFFTKDPSPNEDSIEVARSVKELEIRAKG